MLINAKKLKSKLLKADYSALFIKTGLTLVGLALVGFLIIFYPTISQEIKYRLNKPDYADARVQLDFVLDPQKRKVIVPVDKDFGIVVPKIGANARVIAEVNPFDSAIYQKALTQGVAHAAGTVYPGEEGNTFLFAHSSDNFYNANRYNSVFYLLKKLEKGDEFYLIYERELYKYMVTEVKTVSPEAVEYLAGGTGAKTAILMTCWPPGTTLNRLIVEGELLEDME